VKSERFLILHIALQQKCVCSLTFEHPHSPEQFNFQDPTSPCQVYLRRGGPVANEAGG
jgi:hypothetical protein